MTHIYPDLFFVFLGVPTRVWSIILKYSRLHIGGIVGVKVVVDSSESVEDHGESNHEWQKQHF